MDAMLAAVLFVPGLLFKGMGNDNRKRYSSNFLPGKDLSQASCLTRVEGSHALEIVELEERQEPFNIDTIRDDVRSAVVCESLERVFEAAAAQGTHGCSWPGVSEAQKKAQRGGTKIQLFVKERGEAGTEVVYGREGDYLRKVLGIDMVDGYATYEGKKVHLDDSLANTGIRSNYTAHLFLRLCGGLVKTCQGSGHVDTAMPCSGGWRAKGATVVASCD